MKPPNTHWKILTPDIIYREEEIARGTLIRQKDGTILLVGDINPIMGLCDCCKISDWEYYSNNLRDIIESSIKSFDNVILQKKIKVDNCRDCPFLNFDYEKGRSCNHPDTEVDEVDIPISYFELKIPNYAENYIPKKCPLINKPVVVSLL